MLIYRMLSNTPFNSVKRIPPSEANSEVIYSRNHHLLWNLKACHRFHKFPPPVRILRRIVPIHTLIPYLPRIHFNSFPSTPPSSESPLSVGVCSQILHAFPIAPIRATCPTHLNRDWIILIIHGE